MFITISITDIIKRIYAESALRFAAASRDNLPSVLIRDNEAALRRLACDTFFDIVGRMASHITDFGPQPVADDTDILYMELDGTDTPAAAGLLATAVHGGMSSIIYADISPSRSATGAATATAAIAELVSTLRPTVSCGVVRPSR